MTPEAGTRTRTGLLATAAVITWCRVNLCFNHETQILALFLSYTDFCLFSNIIELDCNNIAHNKTIYLKTQRNASSQISCDKNTDLVVNNFIYKNYFITISLHIRKRASTHG